MTGNRRFTLTNPKNCFHEMKCGIDDRGNTLTFNEVVTLLNSLNEENEQLKKVLGTILLEVKRDISNTNQTGEIRVFINPNSFNLISEVLREYGALKEWYE